LSRLDWYLWKKRMLQRRPWKWIDEAYWWVRYRTWSRYHVVRTDLSPGYTEPETRMFHAMMTILVDFVERELAWMSWCCEYPRGSKPKLPCPARGLAYLDWEIGLKMDERMSVYPEDPEYGQPTPQAKCAAEIKAIYLWYREVYQKRNDPYEGEWPEGKDEKTAGALRVHEEERRRAAEDAEMMKRLVDVREGMWT
jgi:hypothetical protein